MLEINFDEVVEQLVTRDPRYPRDAYTFVRDALDFTQKQILKQNHGQMRHITGQELLGGIREFALAQFGPMTITVLDDWGIRTGSDFGEIVFNMVESSLLAKTDKDTREDFADGYDFADAFRKPFLPKAREEQVAKPSLI
ncbi:MAG: hypothetical protein RLZZ350_1857 [Verrucomicrobiota bacterium]|jgi:uncharacterized repeat protein (TIGR04138 family)